MAGLMDMMLAGRDERLDRFERAMRLREGSRARAARLRRELAEERWR